MRHPLRLSAAACLAGLLFAGCSAPGGLSLPGAPTGPTISTDPAPSGVRDNLALRLDQVRRFGQNVALDFTVGNSGAERKIWSGDLSGWAITTNTGIKIGESRSADRSLTSYTVTRATLNIPLPDAATKSLTVALLDTVKVTVDLPSKDGAVAYLPAPVRQTGLAPQPLRDEVRSEYQIETIRSAGMYTDVTYSLSSMDTGYGLNSTDVCGWNFSDCSVEEASGVQHPLIYSPPRDVTGRATGKLRFLGELRPDDTTLKLHLASGGTKSVVEVSLPKHADSPVEAVAGSLVRPSVPLNISLTDPQSGVVLKLDKMDVLADHTQVHITATGGSQPLDLADGGGNRFALVENSGVAHVLLGPPATNLVVPANGTLDATLVYQRATPADVTSFNLKLGSGGVFSTVLTVPPAPDAKPPVGKATFADVEKGNAPGPAVTAGPTPTASASPADASKWSYSSFDSTWTMPGSWGTTSGVVRSAIKGVALGAQTASGKDVDPGAAQAAERSLKDLGAKETPDGMVLTLPETVLFDVDKYDLKSDAQATLTKVATLLKYYDKAKIGVQGHTDSTGTADHNLELSKNRAQAVATALTTGGVASSRMTVTGFGMTKPVASNDTDAGRAQNRRVEIVLTEAG